MWYKVCSCPPTMGGAQTFRGLGLAVVLGASAVVTGCGGRGGEQPKAPMGHVEVAHLESPDDAPEQAKTIQVAYVFDRDIVNRELRKSFQDGIHKKGIDVEEKLDARAHFQVSDAKITGTVTYVKKGMGRYSILSADLVADAHYDADVQIDLDVKVKGDTRKAKEQDWKDTALGGKSYPIVKNIMPTNIPIAGPLFLHAHFDLNAACELNVEGQMHATTGVGVKGDVHLAAKYKKGGFENAEAPDAKKKKFQFTAKAPGFELSPKPYLKVEGRQQKIKGWCSLQPTAVLLLENAVGARLVVEPWVELEAQRPSSRAPWQLGAEAGVTVSAAPALQIFGRKIGKPKEYELFEISLLKAGNADLALPPSITPPPPEPQMAVAQRAPSRPSREAPPRASKSSSGLARGVASALAPGRTVSKKSGGFGGLAKKLLKKRR